MGAKLATADEFSSAPHSRTNPIQSSIGEMNGIDASAAARVQGPHDP